MESNEDFGNFEILPKSLRIWFFSHLPSDILPKLQVNKTLCDFILLEVYPHISRNVRELFKEVKKKYPIFSGYIISNPVSCFICKRRCQNGSIQIEGLTYLRQPFVISEIDGKTLSCGIPRPEKYTFDDYRNCDETAKFLGRFTTPPTGICYNCFCLVKIDFLKI